MNPLSGYPVTEKRVVSVVAHSATEAEALTKPLALLGRNALPTIEKFSNAAAVIIPESAALSFSHQFRAIASWKDVLKS